MKKPTKTRLNPLPDMAKFVQTTESHSCEADSLIRADSVSSGCSETVTEKWERFLYEREAAKFRQETNKVYDSRIKKTKEEIIKIINSSTFSGSTEERISNYKLSLERKISNKMRLSAHDWELYGHLCFLFGDKSHRALKAAARAYENSVKLEKKLRPALFFIEVTEILRRIEGQAAPNQILLPQEEKRGIENQPYGKQPRAAEMSEKVREAIEKGEHVGAFVQRELIGPSGQTLEFIAEKLGVHWTSISYMRKGRYKLSPELAANLSHYFNEKYTTQELLTIQAVHDAKKADQQLQAQLASLPKKDEPTPA